MNLIAPNETKGNSNIASNANETIKPLTQAQKNADDEIEIVYK